MNEPTTSEYLRCVARGAPAEPTSRVLAAKKRFGLAAQRLSKRVAMALLAISLISPVSALAGGALSRGGDIEAQMTAERQEAHSVVDAADVSGEENHAPAPNAGPSDEETVAMHSVLAPQIAAEAPSIAPRETTTPLASPPDYLKSRRAPFDCVPDTLAYIRELEKNHPEIKAQTLAVKMKQPNGYEPHTLAVVEMPNGKQFVRDSTYGVIPLPTARRGGALKGDDLVRAAERTLREHAERLAKRDPRNVPVRPVARSYEERASAVKLMQEMLPDSTVYVAGASREPLLFMRSEKNPSEIMVYSPSHGTARAVAPSDATDAQIVAAISVEFGYGRSVQRDTPVEVAMSRATVSPSFD